MELSKCLGCMEQFHGYPCPECGFDPRKVTGTEYALPLQTILAGKYMVGRVLGQGGFGITYIGWDIALERKVAIKEYYPSGQVSRSPGTRMLTWYTSPNARNARQEGMQMFLKEARKMARLDDIPGVVKVRDLFQENETAYIIMDFVEGQTLKSLLQKSGPMSWEQAKEIFRPAIQAMEQVHQAGLIHRDLSPDNLMLTQNGAVKILDLGAAKDLNINSGASSMQVAKGGYSPLEQYTQRGGSGPWTDVYAMAATIYFTLTGTLPPNSVDRLEADALRWDLPGLQTMPLPALEALKKAMEVRSKDRTQSMVELAKGLFAQGKAQEPKPAPEKKPSRWLIPAVAAVLAVLCAGAFLCGAGLRIIQASRAAHDTEPETEATTEAATEAMTEVAPEKATEAPTEAAPVPMTHEEYMAADLETAVCVETYVQAHQSWWDGKITVYAQSEDGAYFLYNMACTEEDAAKLVPGTKILVNGFKTEWAGEIEIIDATFEILKGEYIAEATDVTALLGTEELAAHQNEKVAFKDLTVSAVSYKNNESGDDIYVTFTKGDVTADFCVEVYLTGPDTDVYAAVGALNVGDVVDVEGFLYWYNGANTHITSVTMAQKIEAAATEATTDAPTGVPALLKIPERGSSELWATISAGANYTAGLKDDGTMVAVGFNEHGQCNVSGWTDIVAISAGSYHTVGLKADGTVVAVGLNDLHQCDVNDWTDIVAISAGTYHTVGLKADGTVVAVGLNTDGQCEVKGWTDIMAICADEAQTYGLKADGTVVAVGLNGYHQCDVSDWTDIVAISAGRSHTVGLKADGTVVAVGWNRNHECDVSDWTDIIAISAGTSYTVGLKADGTVVAVGLNTDGQCEVKGWTDIVAISAGGRQTVGLKANGTVVAAGLNGYHEYDVNGWTDIKLPQ